MNSEEPIVVAIALSLYGYNIGPYERAKKLYDHFNGNCMEMDELIERLNGPSFPYAATELPFPTAEVYVQHAMEVYGREALEIVRVNRSMVL